MTNTGTDSYKAPEVQGIDGYDGRADVWSLGLVFLELFLG
jgi:serine/threonine protein kinase